MGMIIWATPFGITICLAISTPTAPFSLSTSSSSCEQPAPIIAQLKLSKARK